MKILHVGKFYPPHMGGIETHLQDLCCALRTSIDLQVIVSSDDRRTFEETVNGVAVSRLGTWFSLASTPCCPGMVRKIRNSAADIVHLHLPNPMAVIAYLLSGHRGRLIISYHSDTVRHRLLSALFNPILHEALRRSSAIIASSKAYQDTSPVLSCYTDKCHIIPFGISLENFERCDDVARKEVRRRFGDRLIVSVGRLVSYKGFEYLLQAMTRVRGSLVIVGDGPLRAKLQQLARELGVHNRVYFVGTIPQSITAYYHAADVFALASTARSEAFGIVQIEAMAAGLPVVNTRLDSGVPFVSVHDHTGITVPPADPDALAAALNRLLDNRDLSKSFGDAGRQRAREEFALEKMTATTLDLYERVAHQA